MDKIQLKALAKINLGLDMAAAEERMAIMK